MPIYEYECAECGHRLEAIQKVAEAPLADCPSCGKAALRRLVSAAGFHLKGSGWYATDFKNSGKKKDSEKDSKKDSKDDSKSDSKDDSKSDAKTDKVDASSGSDSSAPEKKAHSDGGSQGCAH
jgi:putative FmdB family regulatory protein